MSKPLQRISALIAVAVLLLVGGPWVYINFIKDSAPIAFDLEATSSSTTVQNIAEVNGDWVLTPNENSVVGYRVKEILFGQSTEGVGRTKLVEGGLTISDNTVTKAAFTVQMDSFMSDAAKRDVQFNSRIMDVETYPTATFTLTSPISLPSDALSGKVVSAQATGKLTMRGTTKEVEFPLEAQLVGSRFIVVGSITIVFDEWGIPDPGLPGISVEPNGLLEFSLEFSR